MSNEKNYTQELRNILQNKVSEYRYPGEILERSTQDNGKDKENILNSFLVFTEKEGQLNALLQFENAFNSSQINDFCNMFDCIDADLLRFRLTGEKRDVSSKIKTVNDYLSLINYVKYISESCNNEFATDDEMQILGQHFNMMYGYPFLKGWHIIGILDELELYKYLSKDDTKFFKLLLKAQTDVLKDKDVITLCNYGYNALTARKMNVNVILSTINGRKSRTRYEYYKQLFFGDVPATQEDIDYLCNYSLHNSLKRKINGCKTYDEALRYEKASDKSKNLNLAVQYLGHDYYTFSLLKYDDENFKALDKDDRLKILLARLGQNMSDSEFSKNLIIEIKKYITEKDLVSHLRPENIINYIKINALSFDIFDIISQETINSIISICMRDRNSLNLKILELLEPKYNNGELYNTYGYVINFKDNFGVTFENATNDEIKRYYDIKERLIFKCSPEDYSTFIQYIINETGEIIYSKEEWKTLISELELLLSNSWIDSLKKELYTEEEYNNYITCKEEAENKIKMEKFKKDCMAAQEPFELVLKYSYKDNKEKARIIYQRLLEIANYEDHDTFKLIIDLFMNDMVTEEEFINFIKTGKKSLSDTVA